MTPDQADAQRFWEALRKIMDPEPPRILTATLEFCPTDGQLWPIFADGAAHVEILRDATLAGLIADHNAVAGDYLIDRYPASLSAEAIQKGCTLEFSYHTKACATCGGTGWADNPYPRNRRTLRHPCPDCDGQRRFPFFCRDCGRPCETDDSYPDCQVLCDACFAGYCQGLGCQMNETRLADGDRRCPKCTEIDRVHAEAADPRWTAGGLKSETPLDDLPF